MAHLMKRMEKWKGNNFMFQLVYFLLQTKVLFQNVFENDLYMRASKVNPESADEIEIGLKLREFNDQNKTFFVLMVMVM